MTTILKAAPELNYSNTTLQFTSQIFQIMRTPTKNNFRSLFLSAILVLTTSLTFGQNNTVSVNDALNIAGSFKPKSRSMSRSVTQDKKPELAFTCADDTTKKTYYYVFNYANDNGFVIISSDKRSKEIIGYSYSGRFDMNNIPDQLKDMLEVYEQELADLSITPDSLLKMDLNSTIKSRGMATLPVSVSPLLENIKFNQYEPYYNMCPKHNGKQSVTGCVATAAAQIMRFYKYPSRGIGSNDYTTNNGFHSSVNFAQATYNWDNILPTYNGVQATTQQKNEVAKLLYHAGASCNMNYTSTGSSASLQTMAQSMVAHFGYDENLQKYSREFFTAEEWKTLLKTELAAGRPVLVEGRNSQSGHCFICDGYDANGLFHINWGWGGTADGYFSLDNLSPAVLNKSYNDDVAIVAGIQPDKDGTKIFNNFSVDKIEAPKQGQCGSAIRIVATKLCNSGSNDFAGKIGFALFANNKLQQVIWEKSVTLPAGSFYSSYQMSVTFPNSVANGKYDLLMVSKSNNQNDWEVFLSKNSVNNCISVTVNSSNIKLSVNPDKTYTDFAQLPIQASAQDDDGITTFGDYTNTNTNQTGNNTTTPMVTPTVPVELTPAKPCITDEIKLNYTNTNSINPETFSFSCNITNTGTTKFSGKLGAFLYNSAGTKCLGEIDVKNVNIEGDQTIQLNFKNKLAIEDGKYIVTLLYMGDDGKYNQLEPNDQSVKFVGFAKPQTTAVVGTQTISKYDAKLNPYLLKPIAFSNGNANNVDASKLQFTCTIQNQSSTQYRNYISAHLYTSANKYVGEIGTQICSMAPGETVELKFAKSMQTTPGKYYITLFYVNESDKYTLLQPRSSSMQNIQISEAECEGDNCVAPGSEQNNNGSANDSDFEYVSILLRGAVKVSSNEPVPEYKINRDSYFWATGVFKNLKRTGAVTLGLCVVKYKGDYVNDIKELETATKPGQKHSVFGTYKVDLAPGKYIITGFVSEKDEYKPIGDSNSNYVILNVE